MHTQIAKSSETTTKKWIVDRGCYGIGPTQRGEQGYNVGLHEVPRGKRYIESNKIVNRILQGCLVSRRGL